MIIRNRIRGFPIEDKMMSSITLSVLFARDFRRFPTAFIMMMPIIPLMSMMRARIFEGSISYMSSWKGYSNGHRSSVSAFNRVVA